MDSLEKILHDLNECIEAQMETVKRWHEVEPDDVIPASATTPAAMLRQRILAQHLMNFRLWHMEDSARRKDVDATVIADCKYRIDKMNQERNDRIEKVDALLVERLLPFLPASTGERERYNTESLGMALDRLSILSLKIFHMAEQALRGDATCELRSSCSAKVSVLREQRDDLSYAVFDLVREYFSGTKRPKVYYQFKMYNDPDLNPELYCKR